jgi:hypothetical protein
LPLDSCDLQKSGDGMDCFTSSHWLRSKERMQYLREAARPSTQEETLVRHPE